MEDIPRTPRRGDPPRASLGDPLRDAIRAKGGFPISDGFVHPLDLVAIGVLAAEEAEALAKNS